MQPTTFKLIFLTTIICCHAKPFQKQFSNDISMSKTCECVPFLLCENGTEIIDGAGLIDMRSNFGKDIKQKQRLIRPANECENILEVCCEPPNVKSRDKAASPQIGRRGCGWRNFDGVDLRIMGQGSNEAKLGEFPWMVAVLHSTLDQLDVYRCGGALIHRKVVLTAAHCVHGKTASALKIRAGEWDTQTMDESFPHQDRAVEAIVIHENYHPKSLQNDFAIVILSDPVKIAENVDLICLPEAKQEFDSLKCIASGWGKNKFGKDGQYQETLKNIQLSIVSPFACQRALRGTILGKKFELDRSFVCASGINGDDMCKGDGGSPLICQLKADPKRFVQVGIVSWGIGCGSDVPAVYANILYARPWIDKQLLVHNLDNTIYQHRLYTEENTL